MHPRWFCYKLQVSRMKTMYSEKCTYYQGNSAFILKIQFVATI